MSLRIGRIAYLNVVPYFHFLSEAGFNGELLSGVPSELNRMLAEGTIDACPSSSFEYGLHAEDYLLLPGHSISSVGPVHSVLLFSQGTLGDLNGGKIALTGESATSVNLLKILLKEFCGVPDVACEVPDVPIEELLAAGGNALLIGDRALNAAKRLQGEVQVIDLGALWYHFTGLPFVFALWILRKDAVEKDRAEFFELCRQLTAARTMAFDDLAVVAACHSEDAVLDSEEVQRYWRGMSYDLTEGHMEGLRLYFTLCEKHGLLERVPELNFLDLGQGKAATPMATR